MKFYRATRYSDEFQEVEVERVTDKFAFQPNGRRRALRTDWDALFATRAEAVQWKRGLLQRDVETAEVQLANAKANLKRFEAKGQK